MSLVHMTRDLLAHLLYALALRIGTPEFRKDIE